MRADSWPAIYWATSSLPPLCRYVVIPVARDVVRYKVVVKAAVRIEHGDARAG